MVKWQAFLDSLTTPGGKIAVVLFMILFIAGLLAAAHMSGKDPAETGRLLATGALSSLLGILYGYLGASKGTS